jgi:glycosyltransferase involved in cell wall biosynthesis
MYNLVDRVVCLSESTFKILTDIYKISPNKISIIANGIRARKLKVHDIDKLRSQLFLPEREIILLYVGRVSEQKGFFILIRAFEEALKKHSDLRLIIAGSLEEDAFKYISKKHQFIISKITFIGFISRKKLFKWYAVADIGIIPSLYEQCSYVAIEMMIQGLPIITSDGLGLRDMFQDGENSLVDKIGNPVDNYREYKTNLTDCINRLLDSKELKEKISSNVIDTFKGKYQYYHMRRQYKNLMKELG